jgi:catalase (peroxidase I)
VLLLLLLLFRSNEYFHNLLSYDWEKYMGPGGHWQWRPTRKPGAAQSDGPLPSIIMLTSDIALLKDPVYLGLVHRYASDFEALTQDFGSAWYKLTTRSMGPVSRCLGSQVPPPQVRALDTVGQLFAPQQAAAVLCVLLLCVHFAIAQTYFAGTTRLAKHATDCVGI